MKIDLSPSDRQHILECLWLGEREELNGLDQSPEYIKQSDLDEKEIKRKYKRLRSLLAVGKTRVNEPI